MLEWFLDNIDGLSPEDAKHYKKDGDRFVLQISGGVSDEEVEGMSKALTAERKAHKDTKRELNKLNAEYDPEKVANLEEQVKALSDKESSADKRIEGVLAEKDKEVATYKAEADKAKSDMKSVRFRYEFTEAADKAGVIPKVRDIVRVYFEGKFKPTYDEDGNAAIFDDNGDPLIDPKTAKNRSFEQQLKALSEMDGCSDWFEGGKSGNDTTPHKKTVVTDPNPQGDPTDVLGSLASKY